MMLMKAICGGLDDDDASGVVVGEVRDGGVNVVAGLCLLRNWVKRAIAYGRRLALVFLVG